MLRRNELVSEVKKVLDWKKQAESYQGNHVDDHLLATKIVERILVLIQAPLQERKGSV